MDENELEKSAGLIATSRMETRRLGDLPAWLKELDLEQGYDLQERVNRRLEVDLGHVAGFKIGGTNKAMRDYINVPEPIAGSVFSRTVLACRAEPPHKTFVRPGIETEIAVRLARAVEPRERAYEREEMAELVDEVLAAIEIVDDRYDDFRAVGPALLVADNAFNAAEVLALSGTPLGGIEVDKLEARTFIDGELVARGMSDALLGHPLEALAWIANRFSSLGWTLPARSFVSLGSITPVQWMERPGHAAIEIDQLGRVEVTLA